MTEPSGLVIVDKPSGITSHDVVDRVRRILGTRKIGHAGTLDPSATGVLVIGAGRATRLLGFLQPLPKEYRAEVVFGITTTTQDADGEVVQERPCSFDISDLEREVASMVGEIHQTPPMVSAVKVAGEPLYRAARRGEEIERAARKVRVYELKVEDFRTEGPRATLFARVSGGTYVRTLASDIGERLGCGAHLYSLRRVAVGSFNESEALTLDTVQSRGADCLLPMSEALRDFPFIIVEDNEQEAVLNGRPLPDREAVRRGEIPVMAVRDRGGMPPHLAGMTTGIPIAVTDNSGKLLAVYRRTRGELRPAAVVAAGADS